MASVRRRILILTTTVWLVTFVLVWSIGRGTASTVLTNASFAVYYGLLAFGAFLRARTDTRAAAGWRLIGFSGVFGTVTAVFFVGVALFPSIARADVVGSLSTLLSLVLLGAGMLSWPLAADNLTSRVRTALDGLIFSASSLFVLWILGLGQVVLGRGFSIGWPDVTALLDYSGVALNLGIVVYLAFPSKRLRGPLGYLGLALVMSLCGQVAFVFLSLMGRWYPAHPAEVITAAFGIPLSLVGFGGPLTGERDDSVIAGSSLREALVYAPAVLALTFGVTGRVLGARPLDSVGIGLLLVIAVSVVVRQAMVMRDLRDLSRALEERVDERTRALENAQRALATNQRLEALGRLAGGIAHDFNNLMTVVIGYANLVGRDLKKEDPKAKDLAQIERAVERGADLTRQLLTFARRQTAANRPLRLDELIEDGSRFLSRIVGGKVELHTRIEPSTGVVETDVGQIEQLLTNLVVNARDAIEDTGRIDVVLDEVVISHELAKERGVSLGRFARLSVSDTGSGIDERVLEHIFEPFFTTKSQGRGTGLGLATCYGIVSGAGGFISVETSSRGTTFRAYLPLRDAVPAKLRRAELQDEPAPGGHESILVVEDDTAAREFIERALAGFGYRVTSAGGGREAIECSEELESIDLLVADINMPDVTGLELANELRKRQSDLSVLFVSGDSGADAVRAMAESRGVTDVLEKPFTSSALLLKVRACLDRAAR